MCLTRLGGRAAAWIVSAILSIAIGCIVPTENDNLQELISDVWPVLAAWLPALFLILSILLSNSDKLFNIVLSKTGRIQFFIDDLKYASIFVIIAILFSVAMDVYHSSSSVAPVWLVKLSTVLIVFALFMCFFVSRTLILIAKEVHNFNRNAKPTNSNNNK